MRKLVLYSFIAVPTILLDGLHKKLAKILFEHLLNALFITALLCGHLLQCLIDLAVTAVRLVIDYVASLGCGLFGSCYSVGPGLFLTFFISSQECTNIVQEAVSLTLSLV